MNIFSKTSTFVSFYYFSKCNIYASTLSKGNDLFLLFIFFPALIISRQQFKGMITPHLAAPGVNVKVPLVRGGFGTRSGTSISAAQTAGIAALLFEWAIIRDNQPFFTGSSVKYYLQRGARREENMQYPNPEWGYGRVDLYHTFELLQCRCFRHDAGRQLP